MFLPLSHETILRSYLKLVNRPELGIILERRTEFHKEMSIAIVQRGTHVIEMN